MITYSKTAQRHIKSLDPRMKERIREGIEKLPAGDVLTPDEAEAVDISKDEFVRGEIYTHEEVWS